MKTLTTNNKQQNALIILLFLLSLSPFSKAQIATSTSYDYININTNSFPIDKTGSLGNTENDYLYSGLYICQTIAQTTSTYGSSVSSTYPRVFTINNPTTNTPYFTVTVDNYCKRYPGLPDWDYRMVFIRPFTTTPSTNKLRTILLNNGASGSITSWSHLFSMGVHDFLMRGYAVAYFETLGSDLKNRYPSFDFGLGVICNPLNNTNSTAIVTYSNTQFAIAAARFLSGKQNEYGVDINNIYAIGHSLGSTGIYGLAYAKQSDFPNLSTAKFCSGIYGAFQPPMGDLNNLTLNAFKTQTYTLKGIGIYGGGSYKTNTNLNDIFDSTDKTPAIIIHGAYDKSIPINGNSQIYSLDEIKQKMVTNSIPYMGWVACHGSHELITYVGTQDPPIPNNTNLISANVNIFKYNNFIDITKIGKPYITSSITYLNQTTSSSPTNFSPNFNLERYVFFAKQLYNICSVTSGFFSVASNCSTNIYNCMVDSYGGFNGNGGFLNLYFPIQTIDFPFSYNPLKVNGQFTFGTCSTPTYNGFNQELPSSISRLTNPKQELKNNVSKNSIHIYPSPASNVVNINFGVKTSGVITMSVFDMLGKNITSIINNENMEQGEYNKQFDASNLPSGVYKLIMNSSDGETITKSIIVQK